MYDAFKNLRFLSQNFGGAQMFDLGKVNVICGKNSSGKTTLLKAIFNQQFIEHGKLFTDNDFKQFITNIPQTSELRKTIWFKNDLEKFLEIWQPNVDPKVFGNFIADFRRSWDDQYTSHKSITYIPPKRQVELNKEINLAEDAEPQGKGVLNAIFYAKTQTPGSTSNNFYLKLRKKFEQISGGCTFDVFSNEIRGKQSLLNTINLKFSYLDSPETWIDADNAGLGLQDLLILLYFSLKSYGIVLVEEPENHLHPEMQRKLLKFWNEQTQCQYFIATHSNIFLNNTYVNKVFFTKFKDKKIVVADNTARAEILTQLGFSVADNLISDLIILVEGPTDIPVIEEFIKKTGIDSKYIIKTLPLGGDIMDKVDISAFAEKYNVVALIDKDPKSAKIRKKFMENCALYKIQVTKLQRYAIENYFSLRVLREIFKGQISQDVSEIDKDTPLQKQIGINVKNWNRRIAQLMELEEIQGTDFAKFFTSVEAKCRKGFD